jgi:formylglycine-generating enzyme required for sulfatase activity
MPQTVKVFISSTYLDLIPERQAVEKAINRLNETAPITMEYFGSHPDTPYDICMKKVAESDIYVGIFAHRCGYIPDGQNQSMTELEYRKAIELYMPVLIYITAISEDDTLKKYTEKDPSTERDKLIALKNEVKKKHTISFFHSADELATMVIADIHNQGLIDVSKEATDKRGKSPAEILRDYQNWFNEFHSTVSFDQLAKKGEALPVQLLEIYVPLETQSPYYKPEMEEKDLQRKTKDKKNADQEIAAMSEPQESPLIDIEVLISRTDNLMLRGNAGTGKTTLVKHLVNTVLQDSCPDPLRGYLPVLVFCKTLWQVYREMCKDGERVIHCEEILTIYLAQTQCGLTWEVAADYLAKQKAIFFFDGLDEAPAAWRDEMINLITALRLRYPHNRFVLTGRPHGLEGRAKEKFGGSLRDIAPLNEIQVEEYIHKWFRAVSGKAQGMANLNAADMLADIRQHEHIAVFTQNPLLLAAVCVLYLSGKRIPDQRADLYNRIVENLLWRRFHDALEPEKETRIEAYLMKLAFSMHIQGQRTIEEDGAKAELQVVFPKPDNISEEIYYLQMDKLFQEIEPNCGLLNRLSDGKLEFFHLTFQEFLAAKYLANRNLPCQPYLDNPWWEEAVILYLGFVNLTMQKLSNDIIMNDIFDGQGTGDARRILMGAKALRDFQASRREKETIETARVKLLKLIDSDVPLKVRFEAGELLGAIGDPRLPALEEVKMIYVPAGEFVRGSEEYDNEKPIRRIHLVDYYIGRYPVTNEEFKRFVEDRGYETRDYWSEEGWQWQEKEQVKKPKYWHDRVLNGPNYPVVGVSWYEAEAYCKWMSAKTSKNYRLPTEAEWEKAARGTDGQSYPWGNEWVETRCNSWESDLQRTSPVGFFLQGESPYGCQDMAGNVWEWCEDWYSEKYYETSPDKNPQGSEIGSDRVLRGGSWIRSARSCRSASRLCGSPGRRYSDFGFRLVFVP